LQRPRRSARHRPRALSSGSCVSWSLGSRHVLPADAAELREQVAAEHQALDAVLQPPIDAHIDALAAEVDQLIEAHRVVADETDIELRAETRWSAIWELSGRCLAICRVVLHDLRGGFTSEAVGSMRSL